ncbi:hypothetical protein RHMOL_Rhmol06G0067500 [Rhododendron molle]|uniref:Uncharacterized protein n=1 Tax=Rhododendron molle TaxID=49168 RepID=A0ACC0NAF1_RHOML|nr:hypothetical protein RHMOL_Rhmol06G0067500 [Rhododendron molle]
MASAFLLLFPSPTISLVFTTNSRSDDHPQPRQLRRPTPPLQPSLRRKIQRNVYAVEVVFKYAICSGRFGPLGEPLPTNSGVLHCIQRNVYAVEVVFKYAICSGRFGPLGEPLPTNSGVLHCGRLKIADFDLGVLYNPEARDEPCVEHWISTINGEQTP